MFISFDKAGITNRNEQENIINNKIKDLYIVRELEDFIYIEKDLNVNTS